MSQQLQQVHFVSVHDLMVSKFYHRSLVSLKGVKRQCSGNILNSRGKNADVQSALFLRESREPEEKDIISKRTDFMSCFLLWILLLALPLGTHASVQIT